MTFSELPWPAITAATGGWVLLGFVVITIIRAYTRGDIVPRRTHDDIIHDRDEWRTAHRISETARVEGDVQRTHLAESARTLNQLMSEMQERLGVRPGGSRKEDDT